MKDLKENWWAAEEEDEKQRKLKFFWGRICELLIAGHLESSGQTLVDFEAFGAPHDLISRGTAYQYLATEVKYIGDSPELESQLRASRAGLPCCRSFSASAMINYLLLGIFDGAKQLEQWHGKKFVAVVVSPLQRHLLKDPLDEGWIDWASPAFCEADRDWDLELEKRIKRTRFRNIESELGPILSALSGIEVFTLESDFGLKTIWKYGSIDT